ncbi:MAG: hypothetical protein LBU89_15135 [Fibromonadaceae bacterium]|jgi:hypothetical protein|nr:hypothetical protein [Fibromonadaceae bacterium]
MSGKKTVKEEKVKKETAKKTVAPKAVPKTASKAAPKAAEPEATASKAVVPKKVAPKAAPSKVESSLMVQGAKFVKTAFFFDVEKENAGKRKLGAQPKQSEKPTVWSRPKVSNTLDSKNLVELLSQQLEYENRTYFEGCEGQICVKCNVNNVDQKFYVNKSLGYCTECAILLDLGQSKEGVFSDAQMELMRRSMEKSMQKAKDIDDSDLESALMDDMDSLELEEALLAAEEAMDF